MSKVYLLEEYHDAVNMVQNLHLEKYGELTQEQSDMICYTLGRVWNREVPGVGFDVRKIEEIGEEK